MEIDETHMNDIKLAEQMLEVLINQEWFLAGIIQTCLQKLVESEFEKFIGAKAYERTEARHGYRNGSYERLFHTRVGAIMLHVARDREGTFKTELFEQYQRSVAFMLAIMDRKPLPRNIRKLEYEKIPRHGGSMKHA